MVLRKKYIFITGVIIDLNNALKKDIVESDF